MHRHASTGAAFSSVDAMLVPDCLCLPAPAAWLSSDSVLRLKSLVLRLDTLPLAEALSAIMPLLLARICNATTVRVLDSLPCLLACYTICSRLHNKSLFGFRH
jgi:hypothetical protein